MRACAVIVTYRTGPALSSCLSALAKVRGLDELVLVDNGNADAEAQLIDEFVANESRAQLIRGQGNVGFAAACNLGARLARSDVIVFVNPDTSLAPDSIERLCEAFPVEPCVVGGDLRDLSGQAGRGARRERLTLWRAVVSFTRLSRFERIFPALRDFDRHRDPLPESPIEVEAVSGALLAMRRADFDALGGFDDKYFLHVEDVDLCRRARDAGWKVLFVPGPHGVHIGGTSDVAGKEIARHKARSFERYFAKFSRSAPERMLAAVVGRTLRVVLPLVSKN